MKILILADGDGKRWNNYQGVPKQLLRIDGETLLDRMIRQLTENGADDVVIVGPFRNEVATNDKFTSRDKRHLFLEIAKRYNEPFIMLNGDCFYTDEIIKDCIEREAVDGWLHWCCPHPNYFTGKPWGEGYIHKVTDLDWWISKLEEYNRRVDGGMQVGNDWSINRFLYGAKDITKHSKNVHDLSKYDVYWHDETDDFDFPEDYDRFIQWTKRNNSRG